MNDVRWTQQNRRYPIYKTTNETCQKQPLPLKTHFEVNGWYPRKNNCSKLIDDIPYIFTKWKDNQTIIMDDNLQNLGKSWGDLGGILGKSWGYPGET